MSVFGHGLIFGLTITLSFGPGFLAIFQTSIGKGFLAGIVLALGIFVSDLLLISLSFFGLAGFVHETRYQLVLGLIASIILVVSGIFSLSRKKRMMLSGLPQLQPKISFHGLFFKGFILNIANPFCLIFWLGMVGLAVTTYGAREPDVLVFIAGVITTAFGSDVLKCYFSGSLKNMLSNQIIHRIEKIAGFIMATIGVVLFVKVVFLIPH